MVFHSGRQPHPLSIYFLFFFSNISNLKNSKHSTKKFPYNPHSSTPVLNIQLLLPYHSIPLSVDTYVCALKILIQGHAQRGEGREKNIDVRETLIGCLSYVPHQGPNPPPRHGPWPGIEPETFGLWDDAPTNRATPARAYMIDPCFFLSLYPSVLRSVFLLNKNFFCLIVHLNFYQI